jgi:hypothetical protein
VVYEGGADDKNSSQREFKSAAAVIGERATAAGSIPNPTRPPREPTTTTILFLCTLNVIIRCRAIMC